MAKGNKGSGLPARAAASKPIDAPVSVGEVHGVSRTIVAQASFQGPLPPPEILAEYDNIHSGLADRVVKMAEAEAEHRHKMEAEVVQGLHQIRSRGQIFAFIISLVGMGISAALIFKGHTVSGTILGGATLLSLVLAFLTGRHSGDDEEN